MLWFRKFGYGVSALISKKRAGEELEEELHAFIDAAVEQKMLSGMTREEALRAARIEVGSVAAIKDNVYDAGWESCVERLWQDVRYGLRCLRKSPGFTAVAVLTLALGVGANTAIFSIVNGVLLRSLPYREPNRLVRIFFNRPGVGLRDVTFSKPELDDLRDRAGVFEEVSAIGGGSANLTGAKQPERLEFVLIGFDYFRMLGATPQIGRLYGAQDVALGFSPNIVISDALWRRDFGADPNVLGRTIRFDGDPATIIGVLAAGFRHPGPTVSGDVEV